MIDMQRWASPIGEMTEAVNGRYVLASDAEAAIAAAEKRGYDSGLIKSLTIADCYQQGQRDMLAKCIAAIKAISWDDQCCSCSTDYGLTLDALEALQQPIGPIDDLTDDEVDAYYKALEEKP